MNEMTQRPLSQVAASHMPFAFSKRSIELTSALLVSLFRDFSGSIALRLWNGTTLRLGKACAEVSPAAFTLIFHNPQVIRTMVLGRDRLRMPEAYFRGDIDLEGDFFVALGLKDHLNTIQLPVLDRLRALLMMVGMKASEKASSGLASARQSLQGGTVEVHSKSENRDAIRFHYDVSNEFYALWLDRAMVYSCAYFERPDMSLDQAQKAKLDHICRKLQLRRGDQLLDIGCGWGALIIHAAKNYGVKAHGVTLSKQQLELARQHISLAGLTDQVTVDLLDYRDIQGTSIYDKVSSVGMFEHVGLKNLPTYFSTVHRLLKPGGLFLNHGITHDVEGWSKTSSTEFINRYVFPDGQLDTVSNIQRAMEQARFEIADVEGLRPHYALTLRHWVGRLEAQHEQALKYVSESTFRIWRLYMAACALEFESGEIGVYQILASKRVVGATSLLMTRAHMYTAARLD